MTQTAHTPGPWQSLEILDGIAIKDNRNVTIAICDYATEADAIEVREWETEANAQVIAAAPELLEALKGILEWWEVTPCSPAGDEPSAITEARDAIAKAKVTE